ncbi:MAG: hypothetical protein R2726_18005 [Acidimicrobiales bacterium]
MTDIDVSDDLPGVAATGAPMLELLEGFIRELREAGLPVSLTENLDAMEAVKHIPIEDREAFKYALAATLVKSNAHWRAFETVFEVYFSLRGKQWELGADEELPEGEDEEEGEGEIPGMGGMRGSGGGGALTPEELAEMLYKALLEGDDGMLRHRPPGREALRRHGAGRPVGGTYYLYRTLRNLDLDNVLERMMNQARDQSPAPLTPLEERLGATSTRPASSSSRRRSRRRSGGGWSWTAAWTPWPRRCASRCPKTSTSCTPAGRR